MNSFDTYGYLARQDKVIRFQLTSVKNGTGLGNSMWAYGLGFSASPSRGQIYSDIFVTNEVHNLLGQLFGRNYQLNYFISRFGFDLINSVSNPISEIRYQLSFANALNIDGHSFWSKLLNYMEFVSKLKDKLPE